MEEQLALYLRPAVQSFCASDATQNWIASGIQICVTQHVRQEQYSQVLLDLSLQGVVKVAMAQLPFRLFAFELSGVGTVVLMPTQAAFDLKRHPNHESLKQNE